VERKKEKGCTTKGKKKTGQKFQAPTNKGRMKLYWGCEGGGGLPSLNDQKPTTKPKTIVKKKEQVVIHWRGQQKNESND